MFCVCPNGLWRFLGELCVKSNIIEHLPFDCNGDGERDRRLISAKREKLEKDVNGEFLEY